MHPYWHFYKQHQFHFVSDFTSYFDLQSLKNRLLLFNLLQLATGMVHDSDLKGKVTDKVFILKLD
jgi:hypothetical protein